MINVTFATYYTKLKQEILMKIDNIVKSLEKIGLTVKKELHSKHASGRKIFYYSCQSNSRFLSFYEQCIDEGKIDSVYIQPLNDQDDPQSDYFCGTFFHTIKSITKVMNK